MTRTLCFILYFTVFSAMAVAQTPAADPNFAAKVDLAPLRTMAVQHAQTIKTFDSYARQTLETISGKSSYNGQDAVFTILDIAYRPSEYASVNLIKIKSVPLRKDFQRLAFLSTDEQARIIKQGTVSLELVSRQEVQNLLMAVQASDVRKGQAVQQLVGAMQTLDQLCTSCSVGGRDVFPPVAIVPPAKPTETMWHHVIELAGDDPQYVKMVDELKQKPIPPLPGYSGDAAHNAVHSAAGLIKAWQEQDAATASTAAAALANVMADIDPAAYPSSLKMQVEVLYNRFTKLTLPGAAAYFIAFVCLIAASRSGFVSLRLWGLRLLVVGLFVHTLGIAVRWWLIGGYFPPIKNEFESVMFSAWFGVVIGTALELGLIQAAIRGLALLVFKVRMAAGSPIRNLFGTAAAFVGFLALIALFTVPYVFGTSIGQEIGQSAGVLMSYWLYIHVTMVTASYALIGMAFVLSVWWLIKYYANYGTLSRVSGRQLEGEVRGFDVVLPGGGGNGGAAALSFPATLAQMAFFPIAKPAAPPPLVRTSAAVVESPTVNFLAALDACNLVVLQLAFWMLGTGIALGAIWADQSWGRFWAWDPKETFAAVTWIVYLVAVHVRVTTDDKAWWTSVLATGGFFVMLFNWVGVNYFLHGLHSYA